MAGSEAGHDMTGRMSRADTATAHRRAKRKRGTPCEAPRRRNQPKAGGGLRRAHAAAALAAAAAELAALATLLGAVG
ncbi:MAG: hypothetical protein LDL44_09875, partial [Caenispirillum sp.]|nr:hypothetical protein [Caenispirillum sp.]